MTKYDGKMWVKVIEQMIATDNHERIYQVHAMDNYEIYEKPKPEGHHPEHKRVVFHLDTGEVLRYSLGLKEHGKPYWLVYTGTKADDAEIQWAFDYLNQFRNLDDDKRTT